jgi:hypothetical protein
MVLACNFVTGQTNSNNCLDESCLETLHMDSVKLNDRIPLKLKDEELISFLGQPDSIVTENDWECGNFIDSESTVRMIYYGKTKFMSSNGTSLLYVLNLEEKRFSFDLKDCKLSFESNKSDLMKLFPGAMKARINKVQSYNEEGRMKVLLKPAFDTAGWMFTFNGELIKEIRLWWFIC